MAHGDARERKWSGNWRMEWVASTLHTTSEYGVSSITTADAHTSAVSSRLNWRPRRFKWTRPFRRKTKSGFCTCAITFQTQSTRLTVGCVVTVWLYGEKYNASVENVTTGPWLCIPWPIACTCNVRCKEFALPLLQWKRNIAFCVFCWATWHCQRYRNKEFCRPRLKCDDTRAETRFRLSAKGTSPFKSAGASVQSTTGSRGVRISGSNAGYTVFRGSVKSTGYPLNSPVSPSFPLPRVTMCHHISTGLYSSALVGNLCRRQQYNILISINIFNHNQHTLYEQLKILTGFMIVTPTGLFYVKKTYFDLRV